jgi:ketol-acid reductoisomerase
MYYDADADSTVLANKKVAVIGYGSQGHAHSLNLRDSGIDVRVGLPETSASRAKAQAEGLTVVTPAQAATDADVVMILTPDHVQRQALARNDVAPNLKDATRCSSSRLNNRSASSPAGRRRTSRLWRPRAPVTSAPAVRRRRGVPCLVAVEQDAPGTRWRWRCRGPRAIGGTRAGVLKTDVHRGDRDRPVRRAGRGSAAVPARSSWPASRC